MGEFVWKRHIDRLKTREIHVPNSTPEETFTEDPVSDGMLTSPSYPEVLDQAQPEEHYNSGQMLMDNSSEPGVREVSPQTTVTPRRNPPRQRKPLDRLDL